MRATGVTFEGGVIDLEGGTFEQCTFRNCKLLAEKGGFAIIGPTRYTGHVEIVTGDNVAVQQQFADVARDTATSPVTFRDERP